MELSAALSATSQVAENYRKVIDLQMHVAYNILKECGGLFGFDQVHVHCKLCLKTIN